MKKSVVIIFLGITVLSACKKDRTCSCTNTHVSQTINGVGQTITDQPEKTVTKVSKAKKGEVDCTSGDETITFSATFGGSPYTIVDVTKHECTLD